MVLLFFFLSSSSQNRREPEEVDSRERQDVSSDQPNHREPIYATLTFQDRQRGNKLNAEYKQQENVIYAKVEKNKKVKTTEL